MKELVAKIKLDPKSRKKIRQKTSGQSFVEFTVILPLLLILFSGMIEFGFMLNTYLSLLDATRFAAREYSNSNPMEVTSSVVGGVTVYTKVYNEGFNTSVTDAVIENLAPPDDPNARQIKFDTTRDDILVSVLTVNVNTATNPDTVSSITRRTTDAGIAVPFYTRYGNYNDPTDTHYQDGQITSYMSANGAAPVSAGLLIVEVYYSYEGTLKLPWVQLFASDSNPVMLYSSTIMPLVAIRPVATPTP